TRSNPGAVPERGPSGIAVTRIDAGDAGDPAAVRAALLDHARVALPKCDALASDRPKGHMELSVQVDDAGDTVAGILHTTFESDELSECLARGLTGRAMPTRGTSYRVRVRLEGA